MSKNHGHWTNKGKTKWYILREELLMIPKKMAVLQKVSTTKGIGAKGIATKGIGNKKVSIFIFNTLFSDTFSSDIFVVRQKKLPARSG